MSTKILVRRGTAATWTSVNPVLSAGEHGFETDTGKEKIGDGSTAWASLAYENAASGVSSFQTRTGAVTLSKADVTGTGLASADVGAAPSASPTLTGTVTIPTPTVDDSSTKAASTAWTLGQVSATVPVINGTAATGSSTRFARSDHVHPTDTSRAPAVESVNTVATSGASQTFPDPSTSSENDITLTANCTFTFPTATSGKSFTVLIRQDATGSRTLTWPSSSILKWANGITPAPSTAASSVDIYSFVCVAGIWYGAMAGKGYA